MPTFEPVAWGRTLILKRVCMESFLLTRALGWDTRIASGFIVPPDATGPSLVLTSEMAAVWPEVRFDDVGWVPFDPVPQPVELAAGQ